MQAMFAEYPKSSSPDVFFMKSLYRIETGKDEDELEEPIKFMLNLFSNSHCPEVIRECYQAAAAEFMTTYTRMWARNLQSRARNR